jgi:hypothetical protein
VKVRRKFMGAAYFLEIILRAMVWSHLPVSLFVVRCSFFVMVGALKSKSAFHMEQNKSRAFAVLLFVICIY